MTTKKSKKCPQCGELHLFTDDKCTPRTLRWRVVWATEHAHGRTNGTDFVEAPDSDAAGLKVAALHPGCVITYTAPDTRDP